MYQNGHNTNVGYLFIKITMILLGVFNGGSQIYEGTYGSNNNSMIFTAGIPSTSAQFTVWPSYDGVNVLSTPDNSGFTLTFWAPAPTLTEVTFDTSGKTDHNKNIFTF